MVTSSHLNKEILDQLHLNSLPKVTRDSFLQCTLSPFFSSGGWYLAGGTAMALQVGHRQSVDLDFFTQQKTFDEKKVEESLSELGDWETSSLSRGTIYGQFCKAKMSLISYPFFIPAEALFQVGTVSVLTPPDIAVMKIVAISQRGKKRDFFDLYWLCKNTQPLIKSIECVERQYSVHQNFNHIIKSLTYFEDAESDPTPNLSLNVSWEEVKKFFQREVTAIAKKVMMLD